MDRLKELHELRNDVRRAISGLNDERRIYEQEIAELSCPFNIGDPVINEKGDRATVDSVTFSSWSSGYDLYIRKIKVDGSPYKDRHKTWGHENWKKDDIK